MNKFTSEETLNARSQDSQDSQECSLDLEKLLKPSSAEIENSATQLNALASLDALNMAVRYGTHPNRPELLNIWLNQSAVNLQNDTLGHHTKALWQVHEDQFSTLLEAICDELVPSHWRNHCLNSIYKPVMALQRLVDQYPDEFDDLDAAKIRIRYLGYELSHTGQYVCSSL